MNKPTILSALLTCFVFSTVFLASGGAQAKLYHLPLFANDLKPGERYFTRDHAVTTSQLHGYDISARRLTDTKWTSLKPGISSNDHWDDPKNTNYIVFGKPFYAMKSGTVIACWRNAPQNPRPKFPEEDNGVSTAQKGWIHQNLKDGLMAGGGNHLWILHDDGSRALYAHATTGSIPKALCPKSKARFDAPRDKENEILDDNGMYPEIALLPAQRKRVAAGQFLGRIGNSGSSTGPHLHAHASKKGNNNQWSGIPLKFKRGMSTPWKNGNVDIDKWTSFSGKVITKGDVLFWPPTRLSKEYARHQMNITTFDRMFKHLANSGFMPKLIDGYSVNNKTYFNHIWVPATGAWRAYSRQSQTTHQNNLNKARADGYAPVFIDSYAPNGKVRYATIYVKNKPGRWLLRSNRTQTQHQRIFNNARADGLKPVSIAVTSINGQRRYTALYRSDNLGGWKLKSRIRENDYQALYNSETAAGRHPVYLNGYMHNGAPYLSAIFSSRYGNNVSARHKMSSSDYQRAFNKASRQKRSTLTVTAFDGANSQHRYAASWAK